MESTGDLRVRPSLVLGVTTYAVLVLMGGLGISGLDDPWRVATGVALCVAYGVLFAWVSARPRSTLATCLVLAAQAAAAAGAMWLGSEWYESFGFLLMVLAVHVATVLRPVPAIVGVLALWAVHSVGSLSFQGSAGIAVSCFNLGVYAFCLVTGWALGQLTTAKEQTERAMRQLRAMQRRLEVVAVERERKRLSRELHDSIKQHVFAASMHIGAARGLVRSDPARAEAAIDDAAMLAQRAAAELGGVIHDLRPAGIDERGLCEALREHVSEWARRTQIDARLRLAEDLDPWRTDDATGDALLRVAQEALANAERHSGAKHVDVMLVEHGDDVELTVTDDGRGFDVARAHGGVGLASMRERVEQLGGTLRVQPTPGHGTIVRATVGATS